jgi:hypothetical protein
VCYQRLHVAAIGASPACPAHLIGRVYFRATAPQAHAGERRFGRNGVVVVPLKARLLTPDRPRRLSPRYSDGAHQPMRGVVLASPNGTLEPST